MKLRRLNITDIEYVAYRLAEETMKWDEPIPDFSTRYTNSLERCIEQPFQVFGGRQLYPGLIKKTSILFYLMIKNHPFKNGNKRVAVTTLLYFLHTNNRWLNTANENLYEFTKMVAASNSSEKDLGLETIYRFIKRYQIREDRLIIH